MKKLSIATIIAFSTTSYCGISQATETRSTYAGIDAVYNSMKFKGGYGDNLFKKNAPGLNLFVGHMFHENFGAEAGFEYDKRMKRSVQVNGSELIGGVANTGIPYINYDSKVKQNHPYIGVVGKYGFLNNTFVSLMVGGSLSHIKANYVITGTSLGSLLNGTTRSYSKSKLIPIVRASVEHKFAEQFGIRGLIAWKNTSAIKMQAQENNTYVIKPKDSFSFGIGALYYF